MRQVSYGIRYMDSLTKWNLLPACLINGTQTVCIHTGQGTARPRFSRKLQTGATPPTPTPAPSDLVCVTTTTLAERHPSATVKRTSPWTYLLGLLEQS